MEPVSSSVLYFKGLEDSLGGEEKVVLLACNG